MKKNYKIPLLFVAMLITTLSLSAHDFKVDGIYYTLSTDKTVAVTYRGDYSIEYSNEYTGDVIIPETITYNNIIYSVTSIGNDAFYDCSSLTSVTIPNSVTSIGNDAFYGTGLTSVTIPNSVTSIGAYAFSGCTGLTEIIISNSVTSIGSDVFSSTGWYNNQLDGILYLANYCLGYKGDKPTGNLTLKNGTSVIGSNAFRYCYGLTSVTIPSSVTSIGSSAFCSCTGLTSVTIPSSVTLIGPSAFYDTPWYNSLPDGVIYINNMLYNYKGTMPAGTSIVIKKGTVSISPSAFNSCDGLTSVTIPNTVTSIGENAFFGCHGLTSVTIPNSVTSIGSYVFSNCHGLTSVTIPNSVTSIGSNAFSSCYGLTSVTIPNSVTFIGSYAFSLCSKLSKIDLSDGDTPLTFAGSDWVSNTAIDTLYIGRNLSYPQKKSPFKNLEVLKSVTVGNAVDSIPTRVFYQCTGLTSITIGNSVTSIGSSAFSYCDGLTSVTIPNSVTSIGNDAFSYCDGLTSVTIPNSVTTIGESVFYQCTGLTSITIGNSVTSIGYFAFYGCSSLTEINITDLSAWCKIEFGSNPWPSYAHRLKLNNTEITKLVIPDDITEIKQYAFYYCSGLTSVIIPNSVTKIGDSAFSRCPDLTSVSIPNTVTSIGNSAFSVCTNLTSIIIPNSVISIDDYAFSGCTGLTTITSLNPEPPICGETYVFRKVPTDCILYVPAGSKEAYANDTYWSYFTNIVEIATVEVETEANTAIFDIPATADATSYVVNVYADETMTQLVATSAYDANGNIVSRASSTSLTLSVEGLDAGTYYYEVIASGGDGATLAQYAGSFEINNTVAVGEIESSDSAIEVARYDIHGRLLSEPTQGVNIVIYSDGSTRKEVVK